MRPLYRIALAAIVFTFVVWLPGLVTLGITGASTDLGLGHLLTRGSFTAVAVAFAGGILTSLTPCVYPLIPITVSIFGAGHDVPRSRAMSLSGIYVLGIASMYSALGALAALTGRAFGSVLQSRWVVGGLALLFGLMAFSMLGAFELRLPASLQSWLSRVGGEEERGERGAGHAEKRWEPGGDRTTNHAKEHTKSFVMGLVAGIIAAPCTGPVLAAALAYVATRGSVAFGLIVMFAYALGIGLPFFLIGTFSLSLPRSGAWMETVNGIFGVALLVVAGLFLKDAVPGLKPLFLASRAAVATAAVAAAAGVLLGALQVTFNGSRLQNASRVLGLTLTVVGITYGVGAAGALTSASVELAWLHNEQAAIALARAEGRPMVIDFWADWCAACKELDLTVWSDPSVREEAQRFVALKLDGTRDSPAFEVAVKKYGVTGMPTVVFIDSRGRELPDRVTAAVSGKEMLAKLRGVEQECATPALACITRW